MGAPAIARATHSGVRLIHSRPDRTSFGATDARSNPGGKRPRPGRLRLDIGTRKAKRRVGRAAPRRRTLGRPARLRIRQLGLEGQRRHRGLILESGARTPPADPLLVVEGSDEAVLAAGSRWSARRRGRCRAVVQVGRGLPEPRSVGVSIPASGPPNRNPDAPSVPTSCSILRELSGKSTPAWQKSHPSLPKSTFPASPSAVSLPSARRRDSGALVQRRHEGRQVVELRAEPGLGSSQRIAAFLAGKLVEGNEPRTPEVDAISHSKSCTSSKFPLQ